MVGIAFCCSICKFKIPCNPGSPLGPGNPRSPFTPGNPDLPGSPKKKEIRIYFFSFSSNICDTFAIAVHLR